MKLPRILCLVYVTALAGLGWPRTAEAVGEEPAGGRSEASREASADGAVEAGEDRPIERWMRHLERQNPQEHARMARLRRENPEAFRAALRERLAEMRRAYEERTGERAPPAGRGDRRRSPRGPEHRRGGVNGPSDPGLARIERRLAELARQYHLRADGDRGAIREEMKDLLSRWAELQFEQAEGRIHRMEEQIERLRRSLDERREKRDETILRRLKALIERHQP